ncbi:MAG: UDP-N-acetylglucosamine 1-carboxyvinyltransferase [Rhodothermales bacterium]|nr:UDP-N-acetylglucosamine 1-carboxyvinyltransferase [Rhodothermales bacterium]
MDKLVVKGPGRLAGTMNVSGSKNTALPLMAGAILAPGISTISNIPSLRDISTFARVMRVTGTRVDIDDSAGLVTIDATNIEDTVAPYELVKRMRASFYMLGALLGRCGEAKVSLPGGCAWGPRPVDLHIKGVQAMGATVDLEQGYVIAKAVGGRLKGGSFRLEPSSVGATINLLLAGSTARGGSRIENAAMEPDVVVFGECLREMGARISGLGTSTIEIEGVDELKPVDFANCPDRIELGTYMIAAALCGEPGSPVRINGADDRHLGKVFVDAFTATGASIEVGDNYIDVTAPEKLSSVSIETGIYPGFPTDLQAQWTILLSQSEGNGKVVDKVYHDRFKHIPELHRMGINAIVVGNEVVVQGKTKLTGAQVMSTDLRASVSLVLAGMVASGTTEVLRVYHLDRGYENLENKLSGAGIDITRESYDEWASPVEERQMSA